jgi:hypothetical protein
MLGRADGGVAMQNLIRALLGFGFDPYLFLL